MIPAAAILSTGVDVSFPVLGTTIPADHGYALFGALCRIVPALHGDQEIGVHPVAGNLVADRRLALMPRSRLGLRLAAERIPSVLPLAGKVLDLDGARVQVGVPRVDPLRPAATLHSRLVIIKGFTDPESFVQAAQRQLDALEIASRVELARTRTGQSLEGKTAREAGGVVRRTLAIHGRQVVGFGVRVRELSPQDSLRLQQVGLGGRRRFGCGVFVPAAS